MSDPGVPDPHRATPPPPPPPPPPPTSLIPPPPAFPGATPPPPGYVTYGAGGAFKRIGGIGKALVAVEAIGVVLMIASAVVQSSLRGPAKDYLDGTISRAQFEDEAGSYLAVSQFAALFTLAALVLGIIWSFRIAKNLQLLGRAPTWKPGLTIVVWILGSCTLGIINFLMFREHWKASDPELPPGDPRWTERPVSPLVPAWLALSVLFVGVSVALGSASASGAMNGLSGLNSTRTLAETVGDHLPLVMASNVIGAITTIVLIGIIRQLTARHMRATHES